MVQSATQRSWYVLHHCGYFVKSDFGLATKRPRSIRQNSDHRGRTVLNVEDTRDVEDGYTGETVSDRRPPPSTERPVSDAAHITFAPEPQRGDEKKALYVPGPPEPERGKFMSNT